MMEVHIVNGPNLNLLGSREPTIYGKVSFDDFLRMLRKEFLEVKIAYFQSNSEGELIDYVQRVPVSCRGLILNAGGYSHTSIALADAIRALSLPVVEVHVSNVFGREAYRHHSYLSPYAAGVLCGFGLLGYKMALRYLLDCPRP